LVVDKVRQPIGVIPDPYKGLENFLTFENFYSENNLNQSFALPSNKDKVQSVTGEIIVSLPQKLEKSGLVNIELGKKFAANGLEGQIIAIEPTKITLSVSKEPPALWAAQGLQEDGTSCPLDIRRDGSKHEKNIPYELNAFRCEKLQLLEIFHASSILERKVPFTLTLGEFVKPAQKPLKALVSRKVAKATRKK